MKNHETVNIDGPLEVRLRRILSGVPGVVVQLIEASPDPRAAALVRLAGQRRPLACAFTTSANAAAAWQAVRGARELKGTRPLLVAEKTTAEAREIMRREGVAYADATGFAHVELPGLFIHTEGGGAPRRRLTAASAGVARLAGKAGVVAQALLLDPRRDWGVHVLAQTANVSPGLAHRVLQRLEVAGIIESSGAGPAKSRRVTHPTALLDLWAEESRDRGVVRTRAFRLAQVPRELAEGVAHDLDGHHIPYAVTGAAAASRVAPSVTAVPVTELWVTEGMAIDDVLASVGAEAVESGHDLVLSQARDDLPLSFRRQADGGMWMVDPLRLYIDLRADPRRGREQADRVREEVIGF